MHRLGVSRRQLFETVEKKALSELPDDDFVIAEWILARVGVDYHVEVHGFFYSVPFGLIRRRVDVRAEISKKLGSVKVWSIFSGIMYGGIPDEMDVEARAH